MLEPIAAKVAPLLIGASERLGALAGSTVTNWTNSAESSASSSESVPEESREYPSATPERTAQETARIVDSVEKNVLQEIEEGESHYRWPGPTYERTPEEIERWERHEELRTAFEQAKELIRQEDVSKKTTRTQKSNTPRKIQPASAQTGLHKAIKNSKETQIGLTKKENISKPKKTPSKIYQVDRKTVISSKSKARNKALKLEKQKQAIEKARANFEAVSKKFKQLEETLAEAQFVFALVHAEPYQTHTTKRTLSGAHLSALQAGELAEPEKNMMEAQQKCHDAQGELKVAQAKLEEVVHGQQSKEERENSNFYNQYGEVGVEAFCYVIGILVKDQIKDQVIDSKKTAASVSAELDGFIAPFVEFETYASERAKLLDERLSSIDKEIETLKIAKNKYSELYREVTQGMLLYSQSKKGKWKSVYAKKIYQNQETVKKLEKLLLSVDKSTEDLMLKKEETDHALKELNELREMSGNVVRDVRAHKEQRQSGKEQIDMMKPILNFAIGVLNARARVLKQPSPTSIWKPSKADLFQVGLDFVTQQKGSDLNKKDIEKAQKIFNKYWETDTDALKQEELNKQLNIGGGLALGHSLQTLAWHAYTTQTHTLFQELSLLRKTELVEKFAEKFAPQSLSEVNKNLLKASVMGSALGGAVMLKEVLDVGSSQIPQNAIKEASKILSRQIKDDIEKLKHKFSNIDVSAQIAPIDYVEGESTRSMQPPVQETVEKAQRVKHQTKAERSHVKPMKPIRAIKGFQPVVVNKVETVVYDTETTERLREYEELLRQHETLIQHLDFVLIPIEGAELSAADTQMQKKLSDLRNILVGQYHTLKDPKVTELILLNDEQTKNNIIECMKRIKQISNIIENIVLTAQAANVSPFILDKLILITDYIDKPTVEGL